MKSREFSSFIKFLLSEVNFYKTERQFYPVLQKNIIRQGQSPNEAQHQKTMNQLLLPVKSLGIIIRCPDEDIGKILLDLDNSQNPACIISTSQVYNR